MTNFPTTFADKPVHLQRNGFYDIQSNDALRQLSEIDLVVVAGITPADVPQMANIATQDGVREFCPKDIASRWGDVNMAEAQLKKGGGRAAFLLKEVLTDAVAGYGWTGHEPCDELPGYPVTFAVRLHEDYRGKHLAAPFSRVIVAGSMALYGARGIGLETWASNTGAVRSYLASGAELVTTRDDVRPTLKPEPGDIDGKRRDVRLFMKWPHTLKAE